ncbi:hypothetical protein [Kitasatospora cineracea]|uniref:Uncharacterized protein n=1 Tax=Kitasatospora cineracea TaxID=88074 RepID=A0A3N4R3W8_9ACTN|nr:hypothetical protein [Kitasatospora cineracea]RPE27286.1 hypothetical protein EDD38_7431 [Kitasatospora cineracea]
MRVRVTKPTRTYWNYTVIDVAADEEHDGEFARHLHDSGVHVDVLEHDPTPEPAPAPGPDDEQPPAEQDDEDPPLDGTIANLVAWVGDDPARAQAALVAEQAKDNPRDTAVKALTKIANTATE